MNSIKALLEKKFRMVNARTTYGEVILCREDYKSPSLESARQCLELGYSEEKASRNLVAVFQEHTGIHCVASINPTLCYDNLRNAVSKDLKKYIKWIDDIKKVPKSARLVHYPQ